MSTPAQTPGLAARRVEAEVLDGLAADDPRALASRRDLARVNALMAQSPVMAGLLRRHVAPAPRRILEIGAGDGTPALALARRLHRRWPCVTLTLLDRAAVLPAGRLAAFGALGWRVEAVTADVFDWLCASAPEPFDLCLANLFLHHFPDASLGRLFTLLQPRTRFFAATETRRDRVSLAASRMLWAIGANAVTRHDAPASVRGGFAGDELGRLWRAAGGRMLVERRAGLFIHAMVGRTGEGA